MNGKPPAKQEETKTEEQDTAPETVTEADVPLTETTPEGVAQELEKVDLNQTPVKAEVEQAEAEEDDDEEGWISMWLHELP